MTFHLTTKKAEPVRNTTASTTARPHAREDILSVILGGDIGAYALGREMHEAYGIPSVCVAEGPIGAIRHSKIFSHVPVAHATAADVVPALSKLADEAATNGKRVFLQANTDALIDVINEAMPQLPDNVVSMVPSPEVISRVGDKAEFAKLCQQFGLETPRTEVVTIGTGATVEKSRIPFPLVAKPAVSARYAHFLGMGFKKVYFVERQEQLDRLWARLEEAGFEGTFLVQELIAGDDTYMDSMTLYLSSHGGATMFGAAHVLLEDHAPTMLGNPVAMITCQMPNLWERASAMLESIGYRGFANFDIKRDQRTGRTIFLEVNPRIGRNSYYNCAAGVNPMTHCVPDAMDGQAVELESLDREILYTLVPLSLLRRYVRDPRLLAKVNELADLGAVFDPQRYDADCGLRRMLDVELTERNQVRKFAKYYPEPTDTSF